MYKNNFVLTILHNNQPLREMKQREVYLPFESEYSLLLENRNNRRAAVNIKIDGTDVFSGDDMILDAYQSVPLERFVVDGNLNRGNRFRFVRAGDSRVSDPGNLENGLIEVEFWLEKSLQRWTTTTDTSTWTHIPYTYTGSGTANRIRSSMGTTDPAFDSRTSINDSSEQTTYSANVPQMSSDSNTISHHLFLPDGVTDAGATVEGSTSHQRFQNAWFGEKDYPSTTMKLWLRGLDKPFTTKTKLYCVQCGKHLKPSFKYCSNCGTPVVVE